VGEGSGEEGRMMGGWRRCGGVEFEFRLEVGRGGGGAG